MEDYVRALDYKREAHQPADIWRPTLPESFRLCVVVGSSGSGKTRLLAGLPGAALVGVTDGAKSLRDIAEEQENTTERIYAMGLRSFPSWFRPVDALSTGERFRADVGVGLGSHVKVDEFTSSLDRICAAACAKGLVAVVNQEQLTGVVLATCHRDVATMIEADVLVDTDARTVTVAARLPRFVMRPYQLEWKKVTRAAWEGDREHHYLTETMNKACKCYEFYVAGIPVAFLSTLQLMGKKQCRQESRLVVKPFAQGLGFGARASDIVAKHETETLGIQYYAKTLHPALGVYRNNNPASWTPTRWNGRANTDAPNSKVMRTTDSRAKVDTIKMYFCHKFVVS